MRKKYDKTGLLNPQAPQAGTPEQQAGTPEQQKQLELFIQHGKEIIQGSTDKIIQQIGSQDPIDGIATATLYVINRLEDVAMEAGEKLDPDVVLAAANQLMGEIIALYEQQGQKLNDEQRYQAFSLGLSMYLDNAVKTGRITKEELQQLAQMMQQTPEGREVAQQMQQGAPQQEPQPQPAPMGPQPKAPMGPQGGM